MLLKFGKFKGQDFSQTPQWYQNWLLNQDWFKLEQPSQPKQIKAWGVYYNPNHEGYAFAGLKPELVAKHDCQEEAIKVCEGFNMGGYLDELHSGYTVKPIF